MKKCWNRDKSEYCIDSFHTNFNNYFPQVFEGALDKPTNDGGSIQAGKRVCKTQEMTTPKASGDCAKGTYFKSI
jgi:hypothetical protein